MSILTLVTATGIKFTSGTPKVFNTVGDSGKKVMRRFCGDCGSPLVTNLEASPDLAVSLIISS